MPVYTFYCKPCDVSVEGIAKIMDRDNKRHCLDCDATLTRGIDYPASVWAPTSSSGGQRV